ncbi:MAG TPA: LEA type 2 family protein [Gammaproteobacteria bacterium]|nr:LEA type 2 family protein [Gammaproteobacteria bacterium]
MSGHWIERTGRRAALRALGATALTLLGCTMGGAAVTPPRITVVNLRALGATARGQRFEVELFIDNYDPEPIAIKEIRFTLRLAGEGLLSGKSQPVTVPALTQQTVGVQLESDTISSLSRLQGVVQGPANALPYEIFGNVILDRRMQNQLPFKATGEVPLSISAER